MGVFEKIFKDIGLVKDREIYRNRIGLYREERLWVYLKPFGKQWKIKKWRPFIIVDEYKDHFFLILLSTKRFKATCERDRELGIGSENIPIDVSGCINEEFENCKNFLEKKSRKSRIFKRMLNSDCAYVLRISKDLLLGNSEFCGRCMEKNLPKIVLEIIKKEMEEWKRALT